MIRKVRIENYKSIASADVSLKRLTVLVGRNSVGKSNFIDAVLFVRDVILEGLDQSVSERHGLESVRRFSRTRPYVLSILVEVQEDDLEGDYKLRIVSRKKVPSVEVEYARIISEGGEVSFQRDKNEINISGIEGNEAELIRDVLGRGGRVDSDETILSYTRILPWRRGRDIARLQHVLTSSSMYSIFPNTLRQPQKASRETRLSSSGDNITSVLRQMTTSKAGRVRQLYGEIVSAMKMLIVNLERIIVRNVSGLLVLAFEVSENDGTRHQLNVSQVSDGALRVLGILVALYQPTPPSLIAIEEPEQNLHPGALSVLSEAIQDDSIESQIIITTHSPHLLDYFDVESILSVTNDQSGTTSIAGIASHQLEAIREGLLSAGEIMVSQGLVPEGGE